MGSIQPYLIYTSEEADAPQYMEHLGIETVLVDPKRTFMSISGAQIDPPGAQRSGTNL